VLLRKPLFTPAEEGLSTSALQLFQLLARAHGFSGIRRRFSMRTGT
jgi:hypothetical protein